MEEEKKIGKELIILFLSIAVLGLTLGLGFSVGERILPDTDIAHIAFSIIIIAIGVIFYTFTIVKNGVYELRKRVEELETQPKD